MVKRQTQYLTAAARPFYSENGEFYVRRRDNTGWTRAPNHWQLYTWAWEPEPNNVNRLNVNLFGEGTVGNIKRRRNRAARTIQRIERGRANRKRTAFARTPFGRLPNNLVRKIFGRK
jgi:hypothetical protein